MMQTGTGKPIDSSNSMSAPHVGSLPDERLVAAAQAGDEAAMNELLNRHYARVYAVCRRIAGSQRGADDATQEALIRIVRKIGSFDGRSAFSTWAYRIASNSAIDELRRQQRHAHLSLVQSDGADREVADHAAEQAIDQVVLRDELQTALEQVPDDFRIPVVLRDVVGLDYHEIAHQLGVPVGTVKSRIARGRRHLMKFVSKDGNQTTSSERPTSNPSLP